MRTYALAALAAATLLGWSPPPAAAADAKADAVQKELAKFQGTWQLLSAETDGKKAPDERVQKIKVVIRGDRHTVHFGDQVLAKEVRFQLDPSREPKTVDDLLEDGRVIRGIYALEGDRLRSCVANPGKERPTQFTAKAGSGHTLRVFRRVPAGDGAAKEAAPMDEAVRKEYARFRGTWKIVSMEAEGMKLPEALFKNSRLALEGDRFTHTEGTATYRGTFKLDLTKKPRQIDIVFTEGPEKGKTVLGIYELEGDTYRLCISLTGKERPKEFASKAGSGHVIEVLQREKANPKKKAP
jgi:uncharacterized protein (TIGR03067 family)